MSVVRKSGLDISVFTVGGTDYLCALENATVTVEIAEEDARGVCDDWSYAWATSKSWNADADIFVETSMSLFADAISGDGLVSISYNTGAGTFTGNALIKTVTHTGGKSGLQKISVKLSGQGALALA